MQKYLFIWIVLVISYLSRPIESTMLDTIFVEATRGPVERPAYEEAFVEGSILYANGVYVRPAEHDGRLGHFVIRDSLRITVNNLLYWEPNNCAYALLVILYPDEPREGLVDETMRQLWNRTVVKNDKVFVDENFVDIGNTFDFELENRDTSVVVHRAQTEYEIYVADRTIKMAFTRPTLKPKYDYDRRASESIFASLVSMLKQEGVVIAIPGYLSFYHSEDHEVIRRMINQIHQGAVKDTLSSGTVIFRPVKIGDIRFSPSVVRSFVEKRLISPCE